MIEDTLAARYAAALIGIARDKGTLDRIQAEMETLADIFAPDRGAINVPELGTLLGMPRIPLAEKIRITDVMLEELDFTAEAGNLLNVLIKRRRIALVGPIAAQVRRRVAAEKGVAAATVETARPLTDAQREALAKALAQAVGRDVDLAVRDNPDLLGGVRVRMGDTLIDGSLDGALDRLETKLTKS